MKELFVLGFTLLFGCVVYPSLATAKAVANGHKKDCTYGCNYGYNPPIDISSTAKSGMDAVLMAAHGLSKIRDEIGSEQESMELNLRAARKMTTIINHKIEGAVKDTINILNDATAKAKAKLQSVQEAASALGTVEDNIEGKTKKVHDKPKKKDAEEGRKHGRTHIPSNQNAVEAARSEIEESTKRSQVSLNKAAKFLGNVENSMQQLRQEAREIGVQS